MTNEPGLSPDRPKHASVADERLALLRFAELKLAEVLARRASRLAEDTGECDVRDISALTLSLTRIAKLLAPSRDDEKETGPAAAACSADGEEDLLDDPFDPMEELALEDDDDPPLYISEIAAARPVPSRAERVASADEVPIETGAPPDPDDRVRRDPPNGDPEARRLRGRDRTLLLYDEDRRRASLAGGEPSA